MYVVVLPLAALIAVAVVVIGRAVSGGGRPAPGWMTAAAAVVMVLVAGAYALLGTVVARYDAQGFEALNAPFAASLMVLLVPAVALTVQFWRDRTTHRFAAAMVAAALGLLLVLGIQF